MGSRSGVTSRATLIIALITGLIPLLTTAHETPSRTLRNNKRFRSEEFHVASILPIKSNKKI